MSDYIYLVARCGKISLEQWKIAVENDTSLSLNEYGTVINPITKEKMLLSFVGHVVYDRHGELFEIFYKNGALYAENHEEIVLKFNELASVLDGKVREDLS